MEHLSFLDTEKYNTLMEIKNAKTDQEKSLLRLRLFDILKDIKSYSEELELRKKNRLSEIEIYGN